MSNTPSVLCPELYALLERAFGDVLIASQGSRFQAQRMRVPTGGDRIRVLSAGEYYRVPCPFCGDSRYRLWIGHRWAEYPWLIYCFNQESCLSGPSGPANKAWLIQRIFHTPWPKKMRYIEAPSHPEEQLGEPVSSPGAIVSIVEADRLGMFAAPYLQDRGFDLQELSDVYGVGVCTRVDDPQHRSLEGRIFIPVVQGGHLMGWQGRYPDELDWKAERIPKYYNLPKMARRRLLYNYDTARHSPTVVLTEGVMDAWSVGPCAVSLLGCSLSYDHRALMRTTWCGPGKTVVVMLDGEAADNNRAMTAELTTLLTESGSRILPVFLPDKVDPGSLAREVCWDWIRQAALEAGVTLELPPWYAGTLTPKVFS